MKRLFVFILILAMLLSMTGCGYSSKNLMKDVPARVICLAEQVDGSREAADFSLKLLQASMEEGENTLISGLSVMTALAMTANGAEGETLSQMEQVLGLPLDDLNSYLYSLYDSLPQGDGYKLLDANSIWFKDGGTFQVDPMFLETNADFYQADVFAAPFDNSTKEDINRWVKEKTDGMIPEILDRIPTAAIMYLINALSFEAQWAQPYESQDTHNGRFTTEDGGQQTVPMMYGSENLYLEDEFATGFIKPYVDDRYAFAALLPKEGVTVAEYVQSLTGEQLLEMLRNAQQTQVLTGMPKFETQFSAEMADVLQELGMELPFDAMQADFSGLGSSEAGNLYISRVLHKTAISVGELGTKASAVTVVEMAEGAAMLPENVKEVYLNRPFVYLLVERNTNTPIFLGTLMDME